MFKHLNVVLLLCSLFVGNGMRAMEKTFQPQVTDNIQHISVQDKSDLTDKGLMKPPFLKRLLAVFKGDKQLEALLSNPRNEILSLSEQAAEAPWGTSQLFFVKTPDRSFIIKGLKKWDVEIPELIASTHVPGLANFFYPGKEFLRPQFLFPLAYISYSDQKGMKHYLSIMPTAPGTSLSDYVRDFIQKQSEDISAIKRATKAFYYMGVTMSSFFKDTNRKITQGDLHFGNAYVDLKNGSIVFIDNERVASSIRRKAPICEDIAFLLMKSLYVIKWTNTELFKKIKPKELYNLYLPAFIFGYLNSFTSEEKPKIFEWLVTCLKNYRDPQNNLLWFTDTSILGFSHKSYMEPIFDAIRKSKWFLKFDSRRIDERDKNGKSVLHHAALQNDYISIWPLIAAGFDVDEEDNEGNTPLHEASYHNHTQAMRALIKAGANVNAKTQKGHTPLGKAKFNQSKEAMELLKKANGQ